MFLRKILDLKDTLSFKLTLWYAGIFMFTSLSALSVYYYRISAITLERTDDELVEQIGDFSALLAEHHRDEAIQAMIADAQSEDQHKMFFRLLSLDGNVIASTDLQSWKSLEIPDSQIATLLNNQTIIRETRIVPEQLYKVRMVYGFLDPATIMQIGLSLEDNEEYLHVFRDLILLLMIPFFILATIVGWFLARKALMGVEEVSQTASEIANGALGRRVEVKKRSAEIDKLARVFNLMLDRLQEMMKVMQEMTDNIAHDLRSPLTRIRGIAEMTLIGKKTSVDYEEMAASTVEECDNLIDIINTMLDISEAEAGLGDLTIEKIDLKKLILAACEFFQPIADEKNIRIRTHLPEKIDINADKNKLQRIVTNLLENAIKYTPPDGLVTISVLNSGDEVKIVFEDTGIGIPEKDMPYIFDRFFRGDKSRTRAGIGLGLSMVKAFTKALKGTVMVSSALNRGSTFTLIIPI